ncbi:venom acid phosphatase Acph-1-like [Diprion similis]|uniref:venom acid phosphatase Acph-1-like n=1 Tax=Diprion similis TaxID=362088 RepID=UPI001EF90F5F|nr:venom acid phosphatase Acph-1-like [Diprion similis]
MCGLPSFHRTTVRESHRLRWHPTCQASSVFVEGRRRFVPSVRRRDDQINPQLYNTPHVIAMGKKLLTMTLLPIVLAFSTLGADHVGADNHLPVLKLVNVVFRHGDRAPDPLETYPADPYKNNTFYPEGRGGLTNAGKMREYQLGLELKARYGDFLGPVWLPSLIEARSTYYDRTKMSLQLVLSALFPPSPIQQWNSQLPWQPVPTSYKRSYEDILLLADECPKYEAEFARVKSKPEIRQKFDKYSALAAYISTNSGRPVTTAYDLYDFYHIFTAQRAANLVLPEWASEIYSGDRLYEAATLQYEAASFNDNLKKLNGGPLVRKISEDMSAVRSGTMAAGRKIYLYSCHETNIGAVLSTLGVYEPHIPQYSSAIAVELWQKKDEYFVKVVHYLGIPQTFVTKRIPGCEELCPLDQFLKIMRPVTPSDSDLICVKKGAPPAQSNTL